MGVTDNVPSLSGLASALSKAVEPPATTPVTDFIGFTRGFDTTTITQRLMKGGGGGMLLVVMAGPAILISGLAIQYTVLTVIGGVMVGLNAILVLFFGLSRPPPPELHEGFPERDIIPIPNGSEPNQVVPQVWIKVIKALSDEKIKDLYQTSGSSGSAAHFLLAAVPKTIIDPSVTVLVSLFAKNLPAIRLRECCESPVWCSSYELNSLRFYMDHLPEIAFEFYGYYETWSCFKPRTISFSYFELLKYIAATCDAWQVFVSVFSNFDRDFAEDIWEWICYLASPKKEMYLGWVCGCHRLKRKFIKVPFSSRDINGGSDSYLIPQRTSAVADSPVVHNVVRGLTGRSGAGAFFDMVTVGLGPQSAANQAALTKMLAMSQTNALVYDRVGFNPSFVV